MRIVPWRVRTHSEYGIDWMSRRSFIYGEDGRRIGEF